jgi:peroxiredoxin Q/BCP
MAHKTAPKRGRRNSQNKPRSKEIGRTKPTRPGAKPGIAAGEKAPNFTLPCAGGRNAALADFTGRKLVLYFYPRADTSGCTKEAIDFTRLKSEFSRAGTDILGVSADPPKALDAFKAKHNLTIALGSDETHTLLEAYGVWQEKSMYGRKFLGVVRSTFLIGPDGRIAQIWPRVTVEGHAAVVLAAAKAL